METQMSNETQSNKLKGIPEQDETTSENQRLSRLASSAIKREQTKALRRYLAEGLDPNSDFYEGPGRDPIDSLLEKALWMGSFECFKVLLASGAEVRGRDIEAAISCTSRDPRPLQLLLDSGIFDPSAGPDASISWCDYAKYNSGDDETTKTVLMKEICEREKAALSSSLPPAKERRARRSL